MSSENQHNTSISASARKRKIFYPYTLVLAFTFVLVSGSFPSEISTLVLVLVPAWLVKTRLNCCIYKQSEKKAINCIFLRWQKITRKSSGFETSPLNSFKFILEVVWKTTPDWNSIP